MSAEMLPVDVVIVGAGPAGTRCAERGLRVTSLGAEPELPDNRVALSQLLAGDRAEAELVTHDAAALQQLRITYRSGVPITRQFGRLCSKGSALGETLSLDGRLLTPEIDGQPASWAAAPGLIANRFAASIAEHRLVPPGRLSTHPRRPPGPAGLMGVGRGRWVA